MLGRFLEHSRVYNFETQEHTRYFIGSADLMPRNLDHRIELVAPVEQAAGTAGAQRHPGHAARGQRDVVGAEAGRLVVAPAAEEEPAVGAVAARADAARPGPDAPPGRPQARALVVLRPALAR